MHYMRGTSCELGAMFELGEVCWLSKAQARLMDLVAKMLSAEGSQQKVIKQGECIRYDLQDNTRYG